MPDDEDERSLTPPDGTPIPALSGIAINLLEVAGATNQVAQSIASFAHQIDEATGVRRAGLCAELGDQLAAISCVLADAGQALKVEAGVRDPVYSRRMARMLAGYALTFIIGPLVGFSLNKWVDPTMALGTTVGGGVAGMGGVLLHGVLPRGAAPADDQKKSATG